ncbi:unnamed protein product [Mytilus coruscus]|uniref:Uncharacterized protein n=1 Tax=Mytilus coruscus TaxID=42192 RepID=A0A6J8A096_MYTCO|nr:unnamed protein product [Mytilus coruscus]
MSYNLKNYDKVKFQDTVEIGTHAPNLKKHFLEQDVTLITLDIKYSFLRELFKAIHSFPNLTYVEILNSQLQDFRLVQCERLEDRLYKISSNIAQLYAKHSGGNQKAKLDGKIKKLAVLRKEVIHSDELSDNLEQFKYENSYGLQPTNVISHDSLGSSVNLELGTENKDMEKMKEALFIMDRFKISDQAYQEVATISDTLPKLHSIIYIRDNMNNNLEICRTPGNTPGAYVSLRTELRKIMEQRSNIPENIKKKISGDGTKAVKKALRNLPDKLFFIIHNETHEDTVQLWKDFSAIYNFICSDLCETKDAQSIFTQCKQWVDKFSSLGDKRKGYAQKNITPYIHCLLYHVPYFIVNYGSLRKFSGQPTEKVNGDIKAIHHQKTNRYDCAMDALKVRKRIEANHNSGREKRSYNKKKSDYWEMKFV